MIQSAQTYLTDGMARLRTGTSWKARAARGGFWLGTGTVTENGLRFARNVILTRILAQNAFGLMFMVTAVTGAMDAFTQIGVKEAVIQSPRGSEKEYLNGAWWLAFLRGAALYFIALSLTPFIASFYHEPRLRPMLAVALLSVVSNGAMSPMVYVAAKEMRYLKWVTVFQGSACLGVITSVVLAFFVPNAWALVIGFAVESFARCALSFIVCPFRPGLSFDTECLRALFRYAKGVLGLGVLAFLYAKADVFVIGKVLGFSSVAMYELAFSLVYFPNMFCEAIVSPILMPTFSSLQNDRPRLRAGFLRASSMLALVFFPALAAMACCSKWILTIAYGHAYAAAALAFSFICVSAALRLVGGSLVTLYFAIGRPELNRWASLLRMVVMLAAIVPLIHAYGLAGAALAGIVSTVSWHLYNVWRLRKTVGISLAAYFRSMAGGLAASAIVLFVWRIL